MKADEQKTLSRNVQLWSRHNPKEALYIPYVEPEGVVFSRTKLDELNLKNTLSGKAWAYHADSGALRQAKAWFEGLNLDNAYVLYVYGVGLGYAHDAARDWLKKDPRRYLVFLEDDIKVVRRLLETEKATALLSDPQVYLHYFRELKDNEAVFESLYWNFAMTPLVVTALDSYKRRRKEAFETLKHKISYDNAVKNALVEEYMKFGGNFFFNFYQNMLLLADSYLGNDMFGKFRKVPAIICGAGPSLAKNRKLLGSLCDKALIFAGGSALNALNAIDVHPHFGAGIDPNAPQFDRLSSNIAFETPFFYRNRMFHNAFKMIHGPRLYVTGSGGYDVADWFEGKLGIAREQIDEGHNVVNFCVEIAARMGCDPIIFVGMDLAFTGMRAYAPGIEEKVQVSKMEILGTDDFDSKAILQKDIYGKPVYTLWKWVAESEWIAEFSRDHPETTLINATEGGLGFPGVRNMDLKDAAEAYLQDSFDLRNQVHAEIQACAMPQVTEKNVRQLMQELRDSLERCRGLFQELISEGKELSERVRKEKQAPFTLQTGRAALYETELAEEIGYKYVLEIFNVVETRLLGRHLAELKIPKKKNSPAAQALQRLRLNERRYSFLRDVAKANISLIDMALSHGI